MIWQVFPAAEIVYLSSESETTLEAFDPAKAPPRAATRYYIFII